MPTVKEIEIMTTDLNDNEIEKCFKCISEYNELTNSKSTNGFCICIKPEIEVCDDALNKSELDIEIELCEELLNSEQATCTLSNKLEVFKNDTEKEIDPVKNLNNISNEPIKPLLDTVLDYKHFEENLQDSKILTCISSEKYQQERNKTNYIKSTYLVKNKDNTRENNSNSENDPVKIPYNISNRSNTPLLDEVDENNDISDCVNNEDVLSIDLSDDELEELSLIDETDVSTIEEFDMSMLEVSDSEANPTNKVGDEEEIKITVPSVVVQPTQQQQQIYIDEKEDIFDPMWDSVKQLSTNEERYIQVKKCWQSKTVPDPNKDLTFHSYRKRHIKDIEIQQPKRHKRTASVMLNEHDAKRSRSCTYHIDSQIQTKCQIKEQKSQNLWQKMNNEIDSVNFIYQQEVQRQYGFNPGYNHNHRELQAFYENQISSIRSRYQQRANNCLTKVETEINELNTARNEVLQFNSFYRGLNSQNDPTILTFEQHMELEEIENLYSQFNKFYG